jgi:hypothetical protein
MMRASTLRYQADFEQKVEALFRKAEEMEHANSALEVSRGYCSQKSKITNSIGTTG